MNLEDMNKRGLDLLQRTSKSNETSLYMSAVNHVIGIELDSLEELLYEIQEQYYIDTATWGLTYWEERYHIETILTDSYEIRRARLKARKNLQQGVQENVIKRLLESLTGEKVKIITDVAPYVFEIIFLNPSKIGSKWIEVLNQVKQAHMGFRYSIRYLTKLKFKTYNARYVNTYEDLEAGFLEAGADLDNRIRPKYAKIKFRTSKYKTISYFPEAGEYEAGDEY